MTKTYLAIAFLITGFLVRDAYGESEVYYCGETASTGFRWDKNLGTYNDVNFKQAKFKMKLDRVSKTIELAHENRPDELTREYYNCTVAEKAPDLVGCTTGFIQFNINLQNGNFVYSGGLGGMTKKTMPICFDVEQHKTIEKYAKRHGMLNASQAIEKIVDEIIV